MKQVWRTVLSCLFLACASVYAQADQPKRPEKMINRESQAIKFHQRVRSVLSARIGGDEELRAVVDFFDNHTVPAYFWAKKVYGKKGEWLPLPSNNLHLIFVDPTDLSDVPQGALAYLLRDSIKYTPEERSIIWKDFPVVDDWLAAFMVRLLVMAREFHTPESIWKGQERTVRARNLAYELTQLVLNNCSKGLFSLQLALVVGDEEREDSQLVRLTDAHLQRLNPLFPKAMSLQEGIYRVQLYRLLLNLNARKNEQARLEFLRDKTPKLVISVPTVYRNKIK